MAKCPFYKGLDVTRGDGQRRRETSLSLLLINWSKVRVLAGAPFLQRVTTIPNLPALPRSIKRSHGAFPPASNCAASRAGYGRAAFRTRPVCGLVAHCASMKGNNDLRPAGDCSSGSITKRHGKRRQLSRELAAAVGRLPAPDADEARAILLGFRQETGFDRPFVAAILRVPLATVRRWEDGQRNPSRAACRLIGIVFDALKGMSAMQVIKLLEKQNMKVLTDTSRPALQRIEAGRVVVQLQNSHASILEAFAELSEENDLPERARA